ncbi:MAG TPA: cbb3-type cytochrome oxidase assembly protein CcoS [Flavobacteriales bacterium]|jgi:cbb3-type cytochrome oxidase maturation protein|nr:cbb3-type cytochrome oxidase assembly protein CcoS [Flavobacteriales bacterium]HPH83047.1 cbb3-type cytochrome oxidase assembly protein CcoS [Flavobacteriales bacterium]
MSALYVLIFISICVALAFLAAFLWSVKKGQFDDSYTPSVRMLFDDEAIEPKKETPSTQPIPKH